MTHSHIHRFPLSVFRLQVLALLVLVVACRKTEAYKFSTDLAVDSRTIQVAADANTTRLIVYSDGSWTAAPLEPVTWMTLTDSAGKGKGEVRVQLQDNSGNLPRAVKLLIRAGSHTDTISLQQKGITPVININDATAKSIAGGVEVRTPITTNVPLNLMEVSYNYRTVGQSGWLSEVDIRDGYLYFIVGENTSPQPREGVVRLSYIDALGVTTKDSIVIAQNQQLDYTKAEAKDFGYIKQSLPTGVISEDIYIEGIVISDKGHPNMAKNGNSATNKHVVDKTENAIAVYVQSLDGTKGIYLKTKTPGDNMFNFNDRVKVWLKGATLERYTNPARVIIKDVESLNIMSKQSNAVTLQPKEKYIKDLTDDDLYTYVRLKDVEISVPHGSFTNINEGYTARMDSYPTNIRDINGSSMYLLHNLDVPWRRDGNRVPQGSGKITGILVSETLERYGGNIGKYALRPLKREDIALNDARDNGFSVVLAEWSRFKTEYNASPTDAANPMTPDIGSGRLFRSGKAPLDFTGNGIYSSSDYNALLPESSTNKGAVAGGAWGANNWWNTTANKGEYWGIEVSTTGITTPLSLQIEGHTDIGGPRNFVVEWSDQNADNGTWTSAGTFTLQDLANWSNTLLTQVAGYKVVNVNLPLAASGLSKLYIRIRAANKNAGTTTSDTGGTVNSTKIVRLAHLSLKYNK